jgi:signal transduction histidine kinase
VDADRVTVVIADDGPGIPSTILPKVDQPFFTTRQNGTGLGLPISRQIAKAHGGFLEIESEAGQGTTVSVTLPLG